MGCEVVMRALRELPRAVLDAGPKGPLAEALADEVCRTWEIDSSPSERARFHARHVPAAGAEISGCAAAEWSLSARRFSRTVDTLRAHGFDLDAGIGLYCGVDTRHAVWFPDGVLAPHRGGDRPPTRPVDPSVEPPSFAETWPAEEIWDYLFGVARNEPHGVVMVYW